MKTETEKPQSAIVKLKPIWVVVALCALCVFILMVVYNLYHATSLQPKNFATKESHITAIANSSDTHWYHNTAIQSSHPQKSTTQTRLSTATATSSVAMTTESTLPDSERFKAMSAPINSNQMLAENVAIKTGVDISNKTSLKNPQNPYVIQAGTLIPGILVTGINSDLPGQIIGQVRANVYDSIQGRHLLIPQGSKLIGAYDAKIIYGQERVLIAWQRLILPNGQSMDLADMAGVDNSGYAGFNDQVNAHYGKLFRSALLMSVLSAGAQLSQPQMTEAALANNPVSQAISQQVAANIMTTASELTSKNINLQPTLEIRPGYTFNVSVTKDLVFPHAYTNFSEVAACAG